MPAGGLFSTAQDVARFCQMMLRRRRIRGQALSVRSGRDADDEQADRRALKDGYGLGWGDRRRRSSATAEPTPPNMSIDPTRGLITVFLVQHAGFPRNGDQSRAAFEKTAQALFGATGK